MSYITNVFYTLLLCCILYENEATGYKPNNIILKCMIQETATFRLQRMKKYIGVLV